MENPEIILNLWYVYDDLGIIYSLRARCYVGTGTDEEKLALLRRFAHTDHLIAQPFPIPQRLHTTFAAGNGGKTLAVVPKRAIDALGGDVALFEEVFVEMEKQLPAQTKLSIGRNPLICITPLMGDDHGGVRPEYSGRTHIAPASGRPSATHARASASNARTPESEPQAYDSTETGAELRSILLDSGIDFLQVVVDRGDVEAGKLETTLNLLRLLLVDAATVRRFCGQLALSFDGYDDDPRELYEIQEVRDFMLRLDEEFPFWLYFINLRRDMLMIIYLCLCPYTTDQHGLCTLDSVAWGGLVQRHFLAMNSLAKQHGINEGLIEPRSKEIVHFFEQIHH